MGIDDRSAAELALGDDCSRAGRHSRAHRFFPGQSRDGRDGSGGCSVPADGEAVTPDLVLAPVVGFDPDCYRLGYGGGYFDRTLATLSSYQAIGIGYALQAIPTIRPQPHDIPMQLVVTEAGVTRRP